MVALARSSLTRGRKKRTSIDDCADGMAYGMEWHGGCFPFFSFSAGRDNLTCDAHGLPLRWTGRWTYPSQNGSLRVYCIVEGTFAACLLVLACLYVHAHALCLMLMSCHVACVRARYHGWWSGRRRMEDRERFWCSWVCTGTVNRVLQVPGTSGSAEPITPLTNGMRFSRI